MQFHLAQRDHTAQDKRILGLFDLIQTQAGQVNGFLYLRITHTHPEHTADDPVGSFLVQLIGLFQTFCLYIFLYLQHEIASVSSFL